MKARWNVAATASGHTVVPCRSPTAGMGSYGARAVPREHARRVRPRGVPPQTNPPGLCGVANFLTRRRATGGTGVAPEDCSDKGGGWNGTRDKGELTRARKNEIFKDLVHRFIIKVTVQTFAQCQSTACRKCSGRSSLPTSTATPRNGFSQSSLPFPFAFAVSSRNASSSSDVG